MGWGEEEGHTLDALSREGFGPWAEPWGLIGKSPGLVRLGERIHALARSHGRHAWTVR